MVCSNCGHPVAPDDQYCGGCGAYLTDAPAEEAAPARDDTWEVPYASAPPPPEPRPGPSAGLIAAAVAAVVLVGLLLVWVLGGDDDTTAATDGTTDQATTTPATGEPTTAATTDAGTPTDTPSTPTSSPTEAPEPEEVELPGSAQECGSVGPFAVYSGNDATSCPFAENVGRAYADLGATTEATTLSGVSSPVTGETYDMTCDFTTPVRCSGGNNAVVYLVPAG